MDEFVMPFSMISSFSLSPLGSLCRRRTSAVRKLICGLITGAYPYAVGDNTEAVEVGSGLRRYMRIKPKQQQCIQVW